MSKILLFLLIIPILLLTIIPVPLTLIWGIFSSASFDDFWLFFSKSSFVTLKLLLLTCFFCLLWAVPAAYLCAFYKLKGRKIWPFLLTLPMGVPTYLNGFVFSEIFHYGGDISLLLEAYQINIMWDIHSTLGASLILSLGLYPYIFLPLFVRLLYFPASILDKANLLGISFFKRFFSVVLPIIMPVILSGMLLIIMETLADFGTTSFYGVNSLSVGLFNLWHYSGDISVALKMAGLFMIFIAGLLAAQYFFTSLQKGSLQQNVSHKHHIVTVIHNPFYHILAIILCLLPFLSGFVVPFLYFLYFTVFYYSAQIGQAFYLLWDTAFLAILAGMITIIMAFFLALSERFYQSKKLRIMIEIMTSAYAFPGMVLGISLLFLFSKIDIFYYEIFGGTPQKIFSQGLFLLVFSYYIRFLTVAYRHILSAQKMIKNSIFDYTKLIGISVSLLFYQVIFPLLNKPVMVAFLFVFIDVIKELPMTLILRPIGYDNLASHTYNMAGLEQIPQSSPTALLLILLSLVACVISFKNIKIKG